MSATDAFVNETGTREEKIPPSPGRGFWLALLLAVPLGTLIWALLFLSLM